MPSLTTRRMEAAKALLQLFNSEQPHVARYNLRDRSKLNQPKCCPKKTQNASLATLDHIVAAATILDHQTSRLN